MFKSAFVVAVALVWLAPTASAVVIDANWGSNATSIVNVVDAANPASAPTDRLRLEGGFLTGSVEGTVNLGFTDTWTISTGIQNDGQVNVPDEFVDIFINNVFVERFFNTPPGLLQLFTHQIVGDTFDYRFEFTSSVTDFGSHLIVEAGTVSSQPVPVPAAGFLLLAGLTSLLIAGRLRNS